MKRLIFISFFIFFADFLQAQIVIHKTLTVEDGLVQSNINAIHEDRNGYLWFATMDGVSRWDGINFTNFQTHNGLTASQVYDIYEDMNGTLYFPTYGGGLCAYKNDKMQRVFPQIAQVDSDLAVIRQDDNGNFYLGGYKGISRIDTAGNAELIDSSNAVWVMEKGRNNSLYFGTYKTGVKVLKNGKWSWLSEKEGLINNAVWRITEASDGALYIGTNGGVSVFKDGKAAFLGDECCFLNTRTIAIYEDHSTGMYFGSMQGAVYKKGNIWKRFTEENGLTANDIWSVFEDSYGNIYFGTGGAGVCIYQPELIENYTKASGLADNIVRTIYEDANGTFYFGTDAGVSILEKGEFRYLSTENGLIGNRVRKITGGPNGEIYFGTRAGVSILKNGKLNQLTAESGLIENQVLSMYSGKSGAVYICTRRGVSILKDGVVENHNRKTGMADEYVTCAYEDSKGDVYFGTYLGVSILRKTGWDTLTMQDGLAEQKILAIHQDKAGRYYFGTYGGGLNILQNGEMKTLDINTGLSSSTIWSIQEDENGKIYLATGKGINILTFKSDSIRIRYITYKDGLASDESNRDASFKDSKGRLWFGTSKGVSCYNPAADHPVTSPPRLHLSSVKLFDQEISQQKTSFKYKQNFFNFEYIGISLSAPEKVRYRYRLSGLEDEWHETTERRARYTSLSSGAYIFEIMAGNEWGYWSAPVRYAFTISPPWWAAWWFRFLVVLTIVIALWQLYQVRIRHLLHVERLRSKIASDLHDDVGSMLTRIFQGSEIVQISRDERKIKQTALRIGELTRQAAQTFSDIVWSIEAQNDTIGSLIDRMQDLRYQLLSDVDTAVKFEVQGLERDKALEGSVRQNIYLIFKEALHNIAKYARAQKVEIVLRNDKQQFVMTIKDDGRGMDKKKSAGGHGLMSMQRRAEQLGGTLDITSKDGTSVRLIISRI